MNKEYFIDDELKAALCAAMEYEYRDVPDPENLHYEYRFSEVFEKKMRKVCKMAEAEFISVGRHRLRRVAVVVLVAVMVIAMTAGAIAIQKAYVKWNENQNSEYGTLDITFEVDGQNRTTGTFRFVKPITPKGYIIEKEEKYSSTEYEVQYRGEDETEIYYSQSGTVDTTGLGIDNEHAELKQVMINEYKGYSYSKNGVVALFWTDSDSLYQLTGNCSLRILKKMAESIS